MSKFTDLCKDFITPTSSLQVIIVLPKIWPPKAKSRYKPIVFIDMDYDLYILSTYGKVTTRSPQWKLRSITYLVIWDKYFFNSELTKDLRIDKNIDPTIRQSVIQIIHNNKNSFCTQRSSRHMFDFEFCLDTGDSKAVCCRQLVYGIHDQNIMKTHIQQ